MPLCRNDHYPLPKPKMKRLLFLDRLPVGGPPLRASALIGRGERANTVPLFAELRSMDSRQDGPKIGFFQILWHSRTCFVKSAEA